jgi:Peptidase family M28
MLGFAEPPLDAVNGDWLTFAAASRRAISPARIRDDVDRLPAPRNRQHAPEAMSRADDILIAGLRDAGFVADRQVFELRNARGRVDHAVGPYPAGAKAVTYRQLVGANIVGIKHGVESTDVILVGAHHDTIRDSPGADDNTASVAALLELARVLGPHAFRDTIVLAAFDMEELSMFGSREMVALLTSTRRVRGAVVYETMSYSASGPHTQTVPGGLGWIYPGQVSRIRQRDCRGDWTAVLYRQSAIEIARVFGGALAHAAGPDATILLRDPRDLPVIGRLAGAVPFGAQFSRSDHLSFWDAGIPAILVTDTANFRNPHYHQPTDTPETLDYPRVAAIVEATAVTVAKLAGLRV